MTQLEAILKIKAMLASAASEFADPATPAAPAPTEPAAPAPTEAAKEYELKAGGKVLIDKLEIGGNVAMLDDAGNQAPAPAGSLELVDGTTLTVAEDGTIAEISTAAEEAGDNELPADPNAMPAQGPADMVAEKVAKCEQAIAELKAELEAKKQAMDATEAKFSKAITDLSDVIVGLINTPSANATEQPKNKFNSHVENKEAKMKRFLELAKSIKK